jgi:tetratricopeptide (TPR) repeat protein
MAKSDQGRAAFPYNPLVFSTSLAPAGADLPGAAILAELPSEHALLIWDVLRAVLLFAGGADERAWWSAEQMRSWEEAILADAALAEAARAPLSAVVGELADPRECDVARLSWACLCLCDWAVESGATETALAWAEAAALAWPANARLAWIAGKMFRTHGRFTEAKQWLRRAARLAVWSKDWEVQARALIALGNLCLYSGAHSRARAIHRRALRIARRHHLREQEAMALHDLFVIAVESGRFEDAEQLAPNVLASYGSGNAHLRQFAHDVAYFWMARGRFSNALPILLAILPFFERPAERLRVLATAIRAAGGAGERMTFQQLWSEASAIAELPEAEPMLASSLLEMSYGASSLEDPRSARDCLRKAMSAAQAFGESDVLIKAETALARIENSEAAEPLAVPSRVPRSDERNCFAAELIRSLATTELVR